VQHGELLGRTLSP